MHPLLPAVVVEVVLDVEMALVVVDVLAFVVVDVLALVVVVVLDLVVVEVVLEEELVGVTDPPLPSVTVRTA